MFDTSGKTDIVMHFKRLHSEESSICLKSLSVSFQIHSNVVCVIVVLFSQFTLNSGLQSKSLHQEMQHLDHILLI